MSDITSAKPVICDRCGTAIDFRVFPGAAHVIGEKNYHIGCVPTAPDPRDAEITSLRSQLEEARAKAIEECAGVLYGMRSQRRDREIELKELGQYGLGGLDTLDEAINAIRALIAGSTK